MEENNIPSSKISTSDKSSKPSRNSAQETKNSEKSAAEKKISRKPRLLASVPRRPPEIRTSRHTVVTKKYDSTGKVLNSSSDSTKSPSTSSSSATKLKKGKKTSFRNSGKKFKLRAKTPLERPHGVGGCDKDCNRSPQTLKVNTNPKPPPSLKKRLLVENTTTEELSAIVKTAVQTAVSSTNDAMDRTVGIGAVRLRHSTPSGSYRLSRTQEDQSGSLHTGRVKDSTIRKRFNDFAIYTNQLNLVNLNQQYDSLQQVDTRECTVGMESKNTSLNRYTNIYCLDTTRVKLRFLAQELNNDYIHANYIEQNNLKNRFILTQGPLVRTIPDFWRMVWQERPSYIFMLCKAVENRKKKSAEYLPQQQCTPLVFFSGTDYELRVTLSESKSTHENQFIYSKLILHHKDKDVCVTHCQWKGWPDCRAPVLNSEIPYQLLNFFRNAAAPTIVHCSAGVGRSGTLVAVEMCLMELANGRTPNVTSIVRSLRRCRAHAVQNFEQFSFIYRSVLQFGMNNGFVKEKKIERFIKLYDIISKRHEDSATKTGERDESEQD